MLNKISVVALICFLSACASPSVTPDKKEVEVKREAPSDDECKSLGKLTGTTLSVNGTEEEALEDMIQSASQKGANYLWVKQYSDSGTTVTGEGFLCP